MHIAIDELFSLKGKVCVVTGGSRGIGRGCADFIAAAGADIALISTTQQAAEAAAACLREEYGVKSIGLGCLVQDREAVFQAMDRIEEELGTPQLLFNNAGICDNGDSENFPEHTWRSILDVNLTGAFFVMQAFAKKLIIKGLSGSAVCTTSMNTTVTCTPQHESAYNASKAGLKMLCRSLAVEWGKYDIRVNCISPGYIMTEMTREIATDAMLQEWISLSPVGRIGTEQDLGGAVVYLLSDAARFTTGAELMIDGGFTLK